MTNEQRKSRAQYLNGLAVGVLSLACSSILVGVLPLWAVIPALAGSVAMHLAAVRIVK